MVIRSPRSIRGIPRVPALPPTFLSPLGVAAVATGLAPVDPRRRLLPTPRRTSEIIAVLAVVPADAQVGSAGPDAGATAHPLTPRVQVVAVHAVAGRLAARLLIKGPPVVSIARVRRSKPPN